MATTLKPETEEKLAQLAERMHRPKEELLEDAVKQLAAYYELLHRDSPRDTASEGNQSEPADLEFHPIEIPGEPASATILRERR